MISLDADAGAVIHTHSKWANLVTMLTPGTEFCISHQEMIKGIRDQTTGHAMRFDHTLRVPIIENTCFEEDLKVCISPVLIAQSRRSRWRR